MNTRTILFDHMRTVVKIADRTGDGSLVRRMKSAAGRPSGKKGPVLPDLHAMGQLAGELPDGYPRDMARALIESCRHLLLDETCVSAIHIRKKLSVLPDSGRKQEAMDALEGILSSGCGPDAVSAAGLLCRATEDLSETEFGGADLLDRAVIQNTPVRMLDAVTAVYGKPCAERKGE